jgi:two-component system, OmpR family, response regulator
MHILLVEDDPSVASLVRDAFRGHGWETEWVADGDEGMACARRGKHDLLILDIELPGLSGLEICGRFRKEGHMTPVLILTGMSEPDDIVRGFAGGADDYLTKPFNAQVLLARASGLVRRASTPVSSILDFGDLRMDQVSARVWRDGIPIPLTPTEFEILRILMVERGGICTKATLLHLAWGIDFDPGTNLLDVHMSRLRSKLERRGRPRLIRSVRGVGFRLIDGTVEGELAHGG